jgi:hypothetical protein
MTPALVLIFLYYNTHSGSMYDLSYLGSMPYILLVLVFENITCNNHFPLLRFISSVCSFTHSCDVWVFWAVRGFSGEQDAGLGLEQ